MSEVEPDRIDEAVGTRDDSEDGPLMLLLFVEASLAVVGGVWLLGSGSAWWLLAVALAVHLATTILVLYVVFAVIGGRAPFGVSRARRPALPGPHPTGPLPTS
jgi:hypothetical protein